MLGDDAKEERIVLVAGFVDSYEHEAGLEEGIQEVGEGLMLVLCIVPASMRERHGGAGPVLGDPIVEGHRWCNEVPSR